MRMDFEIEGDIYNIELNDAEGNYSINVNGKADKVQVIEHIGDKKIAIIKDGKPYIVTLIKNDEGYDLDLNGSSLHANLYDEKDIKKVLESGDGFTGKVVSSIMPGKVVKIFAKEGMEVKKGDPLLIVEAMKMENELKAPTNGIIKSINVSEGKSIESNTPLIIIE